MSLSTSDAIDRLDASRRHLQRALRTTRHPLRVGGEAAIGVANAVLRPVAQRHPLGLVAGAVLVGGLLAWGRPWRWAVRPGLVTGLCQQLVHEAMVRGWPQGLAPPRRSKKT